MSLYFFLFAKNILEQFLIQISLNISEKLALQILRAVFHVSAESRSSPGFTETKNIPINYPHAKQAKNEHFFVSQ